MAQNDSLNPSAYYNIYKVSLTREQQSVLTEFLPTNYSFQPFKCTRSLDDESLRSEPLKANKSKGQKYIEKMNREQRDPDYSASYAIPPKEPPPLKIQSSQTIPGGQPFVECYNILRRLKKSFYSWPFRVPVDPKGLGIPEYSNIVLEPMDLKTIEDNIRKELYKHPAQFHRDIYKILMNSYKFNQKNSEVFATTSEFEEEYLKVLKEAKQGKLIPPEKKAKIEGSMQEDTPMMMREKSSFEQKPRSYHKKDKQDKDNNDKQKIKEKERPKQKIKIQEKIKEQQKEVDKIENFDKYEKQRQKEKLKEIKQLKQKAREQKQRKKFQAENQKMKEKEKQKQKQKQKQKVQFAQQQKQKNNDNMQFSQLFDATNQKVLCKSEKDDISVSNDPNIKKNRIKLSQFKKEKKQKDKAQNCQTLKEIKELKEVTQFENEKGIILTNIQKKLTDLLKKLSEYQLPKPKQKTPMVRNSEVEHPNFNNFSNITTSQKKRLAEKIYQLPSSELKYVIQICYRKRDRRRDQDGVYEFDLQKMDAKTLKQLSNFVAMRTKHLKKAPRNKNESSRVASSQMQHAQQQYAQGNFPFEAEEDEFHPDGANYDSPRERSGENQLILDHPGDDIHSHMLEPNFHFPSGELMQIDDDVRSDSYQPDDNYHF